MSSGDEATPPAADAGAAVDELDALVGEYLACRSRAGDAKSQRELQKLGGKLDAIYWRRAEAIVCDTCRRGGASLQFTADERLLLDMGLLDERLIPGAGPELRARLQEELSRPGAPNHFYFSEWIDDRYRRHLVSRDIGSAGVAGTVSGDAESKLLIARQALASKLAPFMTGLPGVNEQMREHMLTGRLDDQIQAIGLDALAERARPTLMRRHRLHNVRRQILAKLRPRLKGDAARLPEFMDVLYGKIWRDRYGEAKKGGAARRDAAVRASEDAELAATLDYLAGELKFAKSLLPLGALAGGVGRACSVFLEDQERLTKPALRAELSRIRETDRGFTVEPVVVIAPFRGRGFFEFDRDSLFVPLFPVAGPGDAIAHAAGNYRMLIDSFQQEGTLKDAYEAAFAGVKMARDFQQDYRAWIASAGHGTREGMEPERFSFFRAHVGPDCSGVIAPANLRFMPETARAVLRGRLEKMLASEQVDANLYYRLAVLYWQDGKTDEALSALLKSVGMDRQNAMASFSAGILLSRAGDRDRAGKMFELCRTVARDGIWGLYAELAASGELT